MATVVRETERKYAPAAGETAALEAASPAGEVVLAYLRDQVAFGDLALDADRIGSWCRQGRVGWGCDTAVTPAAPCSCRPWSELVTDVAQQPVPFGRVGLGFDPDGR